MTEERRTGKQEKPAETWQWNGRGAAQIAVSKPRTLALRLRFRVRDARTSLKRSFDARFL